MAKAILGCEHTLPSCNRQAICSDAPLALHMTIWHCVKFCVCADLCFYALVCLCMDGCKNMFVCVCNCVFVCILILIITSAWHTDARMQSWPPTLAGKAMCHRTVSCPAAAAAAAECQKCNPQLFITHIISCTKISWVHLCVYEMPSIVYYKSNEKYWLPRYSYLKKNNTFLK